MILAPDDHSHHHSSSHAASLTEAEALLQLSNQESDEGIVSDQSSSADSEADAQKRLKVSPMINHALTFFCARLRVSGT